MKKKLQLICPECAEIFTVSHFTSYNMQEEKTLDAILNDSWIQHECPNCHKKITVIDILIFHDAEKKLMLYFFPENTGTPEYHQSFIKKFFCPEDYTVKIVENEYNDFKETILSYYR